MSAPGWGPRPGSGPPSGGSWGGGPPGPQGWGGPQQAVVCYRHPDRATGLRCARCGRPSCPECLREAAVGFQCVECVAAGNRDVREATTVAGAPIRAAGTRAVTLTLVAINVAVFVLTAVLAGNLLDNSGSALFEQGTLYPYGVAQGEFWRIITSGFLHYGVLHIAVNMYALFILGRELEAALGAGRYTAVYAVSLLGGSASVMLFENPDTPTVGASGAVFGLLGGLAVVLLRLGRSATPVFTIIAINVVISFTVPGISLWGHLGGLFVGAGATAIMVYAPAPRRTLVQVGGLAALTVALLAVIAVRALALRADLGL